MSDFNKVIITGRLAQDPEMKYTQTNKAVANFSVAVNRQGKDAGADFIPVVAWEKLAEICGNNLAKGRRILAEGRLQVRSYETTDGQKRRVTELVAQNIQFLDRNDGSGGATAQPTTAPVPANHGSVMDGFGGDVFPGEEIPF